MRSDRKYRATTQPQLVHLGDAALLREDAMTRFSVEGRHITVAKSQGSIYAFDDTCTHMRCSLSKGRLEGAKVVCRCHAGTFDLNSGEVLSGPPPAPIKVYPLVIREEQLYIEE